MHRSMDAEMDGWRDGWKDGGRAGNFQGGELLFPPTPPALRDREGLVGDATVEASVLPGGGSRRSEGGRYEQLRGSPSPRRGPRSLGLCTRRGAIAPFSGGAQRLFHPRSPPLTPSASHPGWSHVRRGVPAVGEVLRRCLSGRSAKPLGVWGRRGEGGGSPTGRGKGFATGGDPGTRELGKGSCSRCGDTGRFSVTLHS